MHKIVGENVKKILGERGITQLSLAEDMGIDQGHLNRLINNKANWSEELIINSSNILNILPESLFHHESKNKIIPMHRKHDYDPMYKKALKLLHDIFESDKEELVNHVVIMMEQCLILVREKKTKRSSPGK